MIPAASPANRVGRGSTSCRSTSSPTPASPPRPTRPTTARAHDERRRRARATRSRSASIAAIITALLPRAPAARTRTACRSTSPEWRFASRARVIRPRSTAPATLLEQGRDVVDRVPLPRSDDSSCACTRTSASVDRLRRLNEIYWPVRRARLRLRRPQRRASCSTGCTRTTASASTSTSTRSTGTHYLGDVHLPALRAIAVPPAPGPKQTRRAGRAPAPRGPARAGDLRRRGRRARLDRRALLRVAAHARHARARQARVDRRARRARAAAGSWRTGARAPRSTAASTGSTRTCPARELRAPGRRGAAGLHPAADPARGGPPHPRSTSAAATACPGHRRAGLPRRVAARTSATS